MLRTIEEKLQELLRQGVLHKDNYRYINGIKRCHFVWNLYNPDNRITSEDGYVIHHKDENKVNDKILNLQKMTKGDHYRFHNSGDKNPNYGKFGKDHHSYGRKRTVESRRKQSISMTGEKNSNYGGLTKEHRRNISKNHADCSGEKNSNAKVTESIVKELRWLWKTENYKILELTKMFNLSYNIVYCILKRKSWKHI